MAEKNNYVLTEFKTIFNRNKIALSPWIPFDLNKQKKWYFMVNFVFGAVLCVYTKFYGNGYEAVYSQDGKAISKNKKTQGRKTFFENLDDIAEHILRLHSLFLKEDITFTKEIVKDKIFVTVYYDIAAKRYDCFLDETGYAKNRSLSKRVVFFMEEELDNYVISLKKKYEV